MLDSVSKRYLFSFIFYLGNKAKLQGAKSGELGRMGNDNHVVVSHGLYGFQGHRGTSFAAMWHMLKFSVKDLMAKSITVPNIVCEIMNYLVMVFVDEFSKFFNIFCLFAGAWSP
jgi:hypothetical protein